MRDLARPRVISASKRTDIPAFYLKWMIACCREGWVDVPNPLFRHAADPAKRLNRVSLLPEDVLAIVWWSKNYAVYERCHEAFALYCTQYFQFTINSRRADLAWLEPDIPPLAETLRQARFLARLHGPHMLAWRYDPLVFWWQDGQPCSNWDPDCFALLCRELGALGLAQVFVSVADHYRKFAQRMRRLWPDRQLREPDPTEVQTIVDLMRQKAASAHLDLLGCSEPALSACGVPAGACINRTLLESASGQRARAGRATDTHMAGRESCGCMVHTDIGDYVTQECGYSCVYCYARP